MFAGCYVKSQEGSLSAAENVAPINFKAYGGVAVPPAIALPGCTPGRMRATAKPEFQHTQSH